MSGHSAEADSGLLDFCARLPDLSREGFIEEDVMTPNYTAKPLPLRETARSHSSGTYSEALGVGRDRDRDRVSPTA